MKAVYETVRAVGLDVHYRFSQVVMVNEEGRIVRQMRLDHGSRADLLREFASWPPNVPYVLEASFGWGWISDLMRQAGLMPCLSNCYKVEQMRKARGWIKTNMKDAHISALLPSEKDEWWQVWAAPPEVRDAREWMRYRADLVGASTQTKERIHAVFHRHGIFHEFSDLFSAKGRAFLAELCREGKTSELQLDGGALGTLRGLVRLLDHLRGQLAEIAQRLRKELNRDPLVRLLDGVPGFGLILSHVLKAEIGRIERFANGNCLARYCLLAPLSRDTGEATPGQAPLGRHLGRHGNRTLKWAFIEAAHGAVRKGGKWRKIFDAYVKKGRSAGRGYIRVARELVRVVDVVWRKGVPYTDTPPARPGSGGSMTKNCSGTRPGTGQPCHPMVVGR